MNRADATEKIRKRILLCIVGLCLVVCAGLNLYQFFRFGFYESMDISEINQGRGEDYSWNVETVNEKNDIYEIAGWIIRKQEDIKTRRISLVVVNEDGTAYIVPSMMVERKDVTRTQNGEGESYDYDYSGFTASLNRIFVHSPQSRLLILYENNDWHELVDTGKTFSAE